MDLGKRLETVTLLGQFKNDRRKGLVFELPYRINGIGIQNNKLLEAEDIHLMWYQIKDSDGLNLFNGMDTIISIRNNLMTSISLEQMIRI